ncbi:MAG: hypothetical protein M5U34_17405 [Chloroflexi bacterium]|nr:hypothetical protein [Chloroflexota bacterium]
MYLAGSKEARLWCGILLALLVFADVVGVDMFRYVYDYTGVVGWRQRPLSLWSLVGNGRFPPNCSQVLPG